MGNNKDARSNSIHKKHDERTVFTPSQRQENQGISPTPTQIKGGLGVSPTPTQIKGGLGVSPKYDKKNPVLRTKEERKNEVRIIINKLTELELTVSYEPIKELFGILQKYVNEGGKITINIPFPMIERRIKGLLPDTVNEKCWVTLVHE